MKSRLKKIMLSFPGFQTVCRFLTRKHVRVLMYHRFSLEAGPDGRSVDSETLKSQLRYIKRHHPNWVPDEQLAALQGIRAWEACPVVITIDDGYRDFYEVAFPVFRELELKPVLFVTSNFVSGKILLWWDRLRLMLERATSESLQVQLNGKTIELFLKSEGERAAAWNTLADHCRFLPHEQKETLLNEIAEQLAVEADDLEEVNFRGATWDQVVAMSRSGVVIGAHTLNHPILSRLSHGQAYQEIAGSKSELEKVLQIPVDWFCYPQGGPADFTQQTKDIVAQAGFKGSYVACQLLDYDELSLPRYCVTDDMLDFRWCLCGAEYLILQLRKLLGRPAQEGESYWCGMQEQQDIT